LQAPVAPATRLCVSLHTPRTAHPKRRRAESATAAADAAGPYVLYACRRTSAQREPRPVAALQSVR